MPYIAHLPAPVRIVKASGTVAAVALLALIAYQLTRKKAA